MGGKQSKSAEFSSDKKQASSSSASSASNTSQSSSAADEKVTLSKLRHVMQHVGEFLTPEEEARLRVTEQSLTTFFVPPQRTANYLVLTGRPEHLIRLLEKDPMMFFKKHKQITDAAGQIFYNVSPADLISFICDDDMLMEVHAFAQHLPTDVRAEFFTHWEAHHASRGLGGADLVKYTGERPPAYAAICGVTNTFGAFSNIPTIQRPLLKNPDGIICWQAPDNQLHWYYANQETQTLEPIEIPQALLAAHQTDYAAFSERMTDMEPMTARRSSNQEHVLIEALMRHHSSHKPIRLVREGIHYRQDGIDYIDTHYDFNRLSNAYLKCIRLYNNRNYDEGNRVWRAELGHVQREVMWLIQRYCEINFSFWPLDDNYKEMPFVRTPVDIYNYNTGNMEQIFDTKTGKFLAGFGLDNLDSGFAIYRGASLWAAGAAWADAGVAGVDLVAVSQLCIDAIQNLDNFRPVISVTKSPGASL